jgi:hypothetical protein
MEDGSCFFITLAEEPYFHLDIRTMVGAMENLSLLKQFIVTTMKAVLRRMIVYPNGQAWMFQEDKIVSVHIFAFNVQKNGFQSLTYQFSYSFFFFTITSSVRWI